MLNRLKTAGYAVEGVDISESVARSIREALQIDVSLESVDSLADRRSQQFDVAIMRHVLEHLAEPLPALAATRRLLKPGGVLYLAVPNLEAAEAALPGWTSYQPYHLHYFTTQTASAVLRRAGFNVLAVRTYEPFSGWTNALMNSIYRRNQDAAGPSSSVGTRSQCLHHAYDICRLVAGGVIWPLRALQGLVGRGEELEIVARRS